jgi:hypothetical protein
VRNPLTLALVAVAVLLAACSGTEPETSEADPPAVTPSSAAADDWDVPDDLDAAYVQRVVDRLERTYLEAFQASREADGDIGSESSDRIEAIFAESRVDAVLSAFVGLHDRGYPNFRPSGEEEPREVRVAELLEATAECVHAKTLVSNDPLLAEPVGQLTEFVVLSRREPTELNPTGWLYEYTATVTESQSEVSLRAVDACEG